MVAVVVGAAHENFGGTDVTDYRVQVLARPADNLTLEIMAAHNKSETKPNGFIMVGLDDPVSTDAVADLSFADAEYDVYSTSIVSNFDDRLQFAGGVHYVDAQADRTEFIAMGEIPLLVIGGGEAPPVTSPHILTDEDGNLFAQGGPLYAAALRTIATPREFGLEFTYEL